MEFLNASTIGGILVAIYLIYEGYVKIKNNSYSFRKKTEEKEKEQKERRREEYHEFTEEFLEKSLSRITGPFIDADTRLGDKLNRVCDRLDDVNKKLGVIEDSQRDLLRNDMTQIYYTYVNEKKLPIFQKQCFEHLYEEYHELYGNSYVEAMKKEIEEWDTY